MMHQDLDHIRAVYARAEKLYDQRQVEAALGRMAAEITAALSEREPLVLCVMLGGLIPTGQLLTRFDFPLHLDYVHATRYRGATRGGDLYWQTRTTYPLEGRAVLLVDDILDEGVTLAAIRDSCVAEGASEVATAVLVDKRHDRKADIRPDFKGLEVDDRYVFGYGMDYKGYLRNVPGIYAVSEEHEG